MTDCQVYSTIFVVLPEREVVRALLVAALFDPASSARLELIHGVAGEGAVAREGFHREVDVAAHCVGVALLDQRLDHFDHLGNVLGGSRVALRVADPKRLPVLVEPGLDLTGDLVGIDHAPLAGLGVELVLALGVGDVVLGQVPDVGDVHDLVHPVAQVLEAATQQVREHVGAVVADVVAPVDRRAAVVHAHLTLAKRDEVPDPAGETVVQAQHSDPNLTGWRRQRRAAM